MKLKEYLISKKITQAIFAETINVRQGNVSRWISGYCIPSPKYMKKIVEWSNGQVQPNDFYKQ